MLFQKHNIKKTWIFFNEKDENISKNEPINKNIEEICLKKYLYSPLDSEAIRDFSLESEFADLETLIGQIWQGIAEDFVDFADNQSLRKIVALFISTMYLRNLDTFTQITDLHRQMVDFFKQSIPKDHELSNIEYIKIRGEVIKFDSSTWEEYQRWNKNDHQKFFRDFIRSSAIDFARILIKKRWSIIFCEQPSFITSDKPVTVQHPTRDKFGLTTPGCVISFPLSPTRMLVLDDLHSKPDGLYYRLKKENLGAINLATWRNSIRYMISSRNIDDVLLEITNYADEQDRQGFFRYVHNILRLLSYLFKNKYKKLS